LLQATGWGQAELSQRFGLSAKTLRRARFGRGRPPSVEFVLKLRALENLHQAELAALERGHIVVRGRARFEFVDVPKVGTQRPADLDRLGAITSVSITEKVAKPAVASPPVRMARAPGEFPERRRR
jgi:hypothetical protein